MPNFVTGNQTISGYLEQLANNVTNVSGQSIIDGVLSVTTDGPATRLFIDTYNNDNAFGSSLRGRRYRGSQDLPSGIHGGDVLLQVVGDGYNTTGVANATTSMVFAATENWSTGSNATEIRWRTTPKGSKASVFRAKITDEGNVGVGNDTPVYRIDVSGSGNFTQGIYWNGVPVQTGIGVTSGDLNATEQTLQNLLVGGDTNISGNLTQTGAALLAKTTSLSGFIGSVSGALQLQLSGANGTAVKVSGSSSLATADFSGAGTVTVTYLGAQVLISGAASGGGVSQSQLDSLSGYSASALNLGTTGSALYAIMTGLSGQGVLDYVLKTNLVLTGQSLYTLTTGLSGQSVSAYATIPNLTLTGSSLYATMTGMSGQGVLDYATKTNVTFTGQTLGTTITMGDTALSGNLTLTGQNLRSLTLGGDTNLSGALTVSGQTLYGLMVGIGATLSGNLTQTGIALSALTLGGDVNLSGGLAMTGQTLRAFTLGGDTNLSGNLAATGQSLYQTMTGFSGQANANYATVTNLGSTGQQLYNLIVGGDINGSGNLTQSGVTLRALTLGGDMNLSGNLAATGSNLYVTLTGMSGQAVTDYATKVSLASSGQQSWLAAQNNAVNLSGNLTTTGQTLLNMVAGGDANVSGNMTQTGVTLLAKITSLSGFVGNVSGALQDLIAGGGSVVKVSGSSAVATADFSGLGGVIVTSLGGQILISGSPGGNGVTQGQLDSLSGWAASDLEVTQTGVTLMARDLATSGALANSINVLSGVTLSGNNDLKHEMIVPFATAAVTWTNMPAATNFFAAATNYITYVDLTYYTGVNLVVNKGATAAAATGALWLGMRGDPNFTATNYLPLTANSNRIQVNVASTIIHSGFVPLAAGAKSGVYIALLGSGGSAAVSPVFGNIMAIFK